MAATLSLELSSALEEDVNSEKIEPENSAALSLDDFSPIIRRSFEAANAGIFPVSQPRNLWNKLTKSFKIKETTPEVTKFEPVESIQKVSTQNIVSSVKTPESKIDDIDELEIPAFLRRRAN